MATAFPSQIKAKASQPGQSGRGLALQVVQQKDTAAMESLMAGDVDVNAVTSTGMTPLIRAAVDGHLGTVRALLTRGAAVNQKRNDGFAALALAAFFGHEQVVRELLSHGADIKAEDRSGTSAEMWAETRNLTTISDLLREIRERSAEMASPEIVPVSKPILSQPSPQPSTADEGNEDLNETTIIRQRTETIEAKTVAEDLYEAGFPEGSIRRVGGVKPATTAQMIALEDRVNKVAAFSPFAVLVDRLAASWKHVAVVMLVLILLSGVATFAALKAIARKSKPSPARAIAGPTALPAEPEQPASLPNQPATPLTDVQTKTSLEVSTGEGSSDAIQRRSSEDATTPRASHSRPTVSRVLTSRRAGSKTKRRAEKPKSQYRNQSVSEVAKSPHTSRRRNESMSSDSGSTGANEPAAIKIVSEPPAKQVRKAGPAKEIQAQPTAPVEGSSTKRKVIQWP